MTTYRRCEELINYLASENAPSIKQLAKLAGVKNVQQIRHWRDGVRRPNPSNAVALEKATRKAVPRHVWYPDGEWRKNWPEYRGPVEDKVA